MFWPVVIIIILLVLFGLVKAMRGWRKGNYEEYPITKGNYPGMYDGSD